MFHHTIEDRSAQANFHWFLLAFLGGSVNTGGFLACNRFVSHVTGFASLYGIELARGRLDAAIGVASVPLYFLLGVCISGYLVERRIHDQKTPLYPLVMALVTACLLAAALLGYHGYFSGWGGDLKLRRDYLLLALLTMASGLQNAAVTTATSATIRTTHMTGNTTDLGLSLVRLITRGISGERRVKEVRATRIRAGTILAFGAGSAVSAALYFRYHYLGFLLPAGIGFYTTLVALRTSTGLAEKAPPRPEPAV